MARQNRSRPQQREVPSRVLRVGVLFQGRIVEERLVAPGERFTVGPTF